MPPLSLPLPPSSSPLPPRHHPLPLPHAPPAASVGSQPPTSHCPLEVTLVVVADSQHPCLWTPQTLSPLSTYFTLLGTVSVALPLPLTIKLTVLPLPTLWSPPMPQSPMSRRLCAWGEHPPIQLLPSCRCPSGPHHRQCLSGPS